MDATTNDPPPEPSLLEQFGAWLDAFPAVPNWLEWMAIFVAISGPIIFLLWRRWGANWWAARSRDSAVRRGKTIGHKVLRAHKLCRNRPALLIRVAFFLAWCVFISMVFTWAWIMMANLYGADKGGLPPSDNVVVARFILAQILWASAFVTVVVLFVWFSLTLAPLVDIDRYTLISRKRIERMVIKSGAPQETVTSVLTTFDDLVDEIQEQEIR